MTRLCVFLYLGVPFIAGFLTRYFFKKAKGEDWYVKNVLPRILAVQNSYLVTRTSHLLPQTVNFLLDPLFFSVRFG
jgi:uncharacterized membrane-anchored protein